MYRVRKQPWLSRESAAIGSICLHLIAHAFPPPRPPDFSFSFFRNERRFPRPKAEFHDALLSVSHSTRRDLSCLNEMQSISRFFLPFLFVRAVFGMRSIRIGRAFKREEGEGRGELVKKRSFSFA